MLGTIQHNEIGELCQRDEIILKQESVGLYSLANGQQAKHTRNSMREMARILKCTQEHLDSREVTMAELLNVTQYSTLENALITLSWDKESGEQKHGLLLSIGNNLMKLVSFEIARYAFI